MPLIPLFIQPTPREITEVIEAENRTEIIEAELRTEIVEAESRNETVR